MPKESSVASNRTRVSPYPLRSSRSNKQKAPEWSPIQTESAGQWEDVRCVICQEPPHNAVLLQCSSSSNGCRAYMCDTSARHSNCFRQFRKKNRNRLNPRTLNCPLCRGEVYETTNVPGGRRCMNAKPRSCSFEDCDFSGTYSQLKSHLKTKHPGLIPQTVDPCRQRRWEQMQREDEYNEIMSAAGIPLMHHMYSYAHLFLVRLNVDGIVHNAFVARQVSFRFATANYAPTLAFRVMNGQTP